MKVLFLINPRSGKRRGYDIEELIHSHCTTWTYEIRLADNKAALDRLIDDAIRDGFEVVYAVGGDGTVHELGKRLVNRPIALGVLPIGSGNGFARHLGLTMAPGPSLEACRDGEFMSIDTGLVNDTPFLGVMGMGFDAEIAHRFATSTTRGLRSYLRAGARAFFESRATHYEITVDGTTVSRKASLIAVSNSSQYGNDARIAPNASLQDGLLDIVIAGEVRLLSAIRLLSRLFTGTFHFSRHVEIIRGREIVIRREREGPVHLDGEPFVMGAELRIAVRPESLKVLVPAATTRI